VLPPDLFKQYDALSFWRDSQGSAAHVIRPKSSSDDRKSAVAGEPG
jgi:sulfotransferase